MSVPVSDIVQLSLIGILGAVVVLKLVLPWAAAIKSNGHRSSAEATSQRQRLAMCEAARHDPSFVKLVDLAERQVDISERIADTLSKLQIRQEQIASETQREIAAEFRRNLRAQ